jgi:hypothetical protein
MLKKNTSTPKTTHTPVPRLPLTKLEKKNDFPGHRNRNHGTPIKSALDPTSSPLNIPKAAVDDSIPSTPVNNTPADDPHDSLSDVPLSSSEASSDEQRGKRIKIPNVSEERITAHLEKEQVPQPACSKANTSQEKKDNFFIRVIQYIGYAIVFIFTFGQINLFTKCEKKSNIPKHDNTDLPTTPRSNIDPNNNRDTLYGSRISASTPRDSNSDLNTQGHPTHTEYPLNQVYDLAQDTLAHTEETSLSQKEQTKLKHQIKVQLKDSKKNIASKKERIQSLFDKKAKQETVLKKMQLVEKGLIKQRVLTQQLKTKFEQLKKSLEKNQCMEINHLKEKIKTLAKNFDSLEAYYQAGQPKQFHLTCALFVIQLTETHLDEKIAELSTIEQSLTEEKISQLQQKISACETKINNNNGLILEAQNDIRFMVTQCINQIHILLTDHQKLATKISDTLSAISNLIAILETFEKRVLKEKLPSITQYIYAFQWLEDMWNNPNSKHRQERIREEISLKIDQLSVQQKQHCFKEKQRAFNHEIMKFFQTLFPREYNYQRNLVVDHEKNNLFSEAEKMLKSINNNLEINNGIHTQEDVNFKQLLEALLDPQLAPTSSQTGAGLLLPFEEKLSDLMYFLSTKNLRQIADYLDSQHPVREHRRILQALQKQTPRKSSLFNALDVEKPEISPTNTHSPQKRAKNRL